MPTSFCYDNCSTPSLGSSKSTSCSSSRVLHHSLSLLFIPPTTLEIDLPLNSPQLSNLSEPSVSCTQIRETEAQKGEIIGSSPHSTKCYPGGTKSLTLANQKPTSLAGELMALGVLTVMPLYLAHNKTDC